MHKGCLTQPTKEALLEWIGHLLDELDLETLRDFNYQVQNTFEKYDYAKETLTINITTLLNPEKLKKEKTNGRI